MARGKTKESTTGRSIIILFIYLFLWWILMTVVNVVAGFDETDLMYHIIELLRISVPVFALLFGIPIILIVGYDKKTKKKK